MVMGRDSCSEGCEFYSQFHILDGHFSHSIFVVKILMFKQTFLNKKTKINEKEAGYGAFKKRKVKQLHTNHFNASIAK